MNQYLSLLNIIFFDSTSKLTSETLSSTMATALPNTGQPNPPSSNMNIPNQHQNTHQPNPNPQPSSMPSVKTSNSIPFKYVHNFKYNYDHTKSQIVHLPELANTYEKIIGLTPTQFDWKDDMKTLVVTILNNKEIIHTVGILDNLARYGISPKLNSIQTDKNSIFCLNGPTVLFKHDKNLIIDNINDDNKNIFVVDCYVIPAKNENQKSASIKLTLATQAMTNMVISHGIKLYNKYINPTLITRSKVLNTTQCSKCQKFEHGYNACKNVNHVCPHCTGDHEIKNCNNKNQIAKCNNCGGSHRTTSNICPIKQKFLIIPTTNTDIHNSNSLRVNPESTFIEAPIPINNPWSTQNLNPNTPLLPTPPQINNINSFPNLPSTSKTPLLPTPTNFHPIPNLYQNNSNNAFPNNNIHNNIQPNNSTQPIITYDQCLSMAIKFIDWPFAFKELQKAFHLHPVIEIPSSLHGQLKPEYSSINPSNHSSTTTIPLLTSTPQQIINQSATYPQPQITHANSTPAAANYSSLTPQIPSSKNNFQNNKKGAIPKTPIIPTNTSSNITDKQQSSPHIPSSPEADEPAPINHSHSNESSSNESIDILNVSDHESTIINNPNCYSTPIQKTNSTYSSNKHNPTPIKPSPKKKKIKLTNRKITPQEIGNIGPISPTELRTNKRLRSQTKTLGSYASSSLSINSDSSSYD